MEIFVQQVFLEISAFKVKTFGRVFGRFISKFSGAVLDPFSVTIFINYKPFELVNYKHMSVGTRKCP